MTAFRAFLFDFDGVLGDTAALNHETYDLALRTHGYSLSIEDFVTQYIHLKDDDVFRTASQDRDLGFSEKDIADLTALKRGLFLERLGSRNLLFAGAAEFVRRVHQRGPCAIVSMSYWPNVEKILERGGIYDCFSVFVTEADVTRPKPDPQPYLIGLERLNAEQRERKAAPLAASECLIIEDTRAGLRSGKAAGMHSAALTHTTPAELLSEAEPDTLAKSFAQLAQLFAQQGRI